jgi:hypothetical protein
MFHVSPWTTTTSGFPISLKSSGRFSDTFSGTGHPRGIGSELAVSYGFARLRVMHFPALSAA